jgi:uncharacterized protein with NRDE domain
MMMCVAWIAFRHHPDFKMIIAANRDEFYARPTASAAYWPDTDGIAGGRDLKDQGTWFAAHMDGRMGLLTNHRDFKLHKEAPKSRGILISTYLESDASALASLHQVKSESQDYNPFNLVLMDQKGLYHYDNIQNRITTLAPGIYSLSNAFLDTPWPKVILGKKMFEDLLKSKTNMLLPEHFLEMLKDTTTAQDESLPDTGLEIDLERQLSAICIDAGTYGTRAHTVFTMDYEGRMTLLEQSLLITPGGQKSWRTTKLDFRLQQKSS